ncbi:hypothetical protein [Microcoleus sp. herbarium14]
MLRGTPSLASLPSNSSKRRLRILLQVRSHRNSHNPTIARILAGIWA